MAVYKVEICGVNTSKLPILKEEEKEALFKRIKAGDTAARNVYQRQSPPCPKRNQTLFRQQRKCRRSVSDWLHWPH